MIKRLAVVVLLAAGISAQVVVSPASFNTQSGSQPNGLAWGLVTAPVCGTCTQYAGTTLTASGGVGITSSNPYVWTIKDNGFVVETCSASKCTTPAYAYYLVQTHQGQVDASGDSTGTNATVVYNAPIDFPDNLSLQICASDGSTTGCTTAAISPGLAFPAAFVTARARALGMNNMPWTVWAGGTTVSAAPPNMTYFPNPYWPGTYMGLWTLANAAVHSPVTAGSAIERPDWSYDGKWMVWTSQQCIVATFCPTTGQEVYAERSDGSTLMNSARVNELWSTYTWDLHRPDWMLVENEDASWPSPATGRVDVIDLGNPTVITKVASYTSSVQGCHSLVGNLCEQVFASQMGGADNSRNFLLEANYTDASNNQQCWPTATCPGGDGPRMTTLDFAGCEATLAANCATQVGTWSMNFSLGTYTSGTGSCVGTESGDGYVGTSTYYNSLGNPHEISPCEAGEHDPDYVRGQNLITWNYGPRGSGGESLFFSIGDNGTGVAQYYPLQTAQNNRSYWSHPARNSAGNLITFAGGQYCGPSGHACTNGTAVIGFWDTRQETAGCPTDPTFPDTRCGLVQSVSVTYGHGAWDGFNNNLVGHDDGGQTLVGGVNHEVMSQSTWNLSYEVESKLFDWGNRPENASSGVTNFSIIDSPTQSPDATKLGEAIPITVSQDSTNTDMSVPAYFQVGTPAAPILLTLASTSAATIQFYPAALNHEAAKYWVWKQPSCTGAWTRLASVAAVYTNLVPLTGSTVTPYTYTDSTLGAGANACYGFTTQEWSGQESAFMSAQLGVTNTAGVFSVTSHVPSGTVNFDSAPNPVTGFTVAAQATCATNCAGVGIPTAPNVTPGTGGSLAAGAWNTKISYCKYTDFPKNTVCAQTLLSAATGSTVAASGTLTVSGSSSEMVGQDGFCVYDSGPSDGGTYFPDGCFHILDAANAPSGSTGGSSYAVTISTHATSGSTPVSNTTLGDYDYAWSLPADPDLRFVLILYSSNGVAPSASNPWPYEVAVAPGTATSYQFFFPTQNPSGHVIGAVETIDAQGRLSSCVAYDATAATSVSCSQ